MVMFTIDTNIVMDANILVHFFWSFYSTVGDKISEKGYMQIGNLVKCAMIDYVTNMNYVGHLLCALCSTVWIDMGSS